MSDLQVVYRAPAELKPQPRNPRTHSKKQIRQIADSIRSFGFTNPVLIDDAGEIIAGHGRVEAARQLGLKTVPTIRLSAILATLRDLQITRRQGPRSIPRFVGTSAGSGRPC